MPEQETTYSIAMLAAVRRLGELGFENIDEGGFSCDEGSAQIVANNGGIIVNQEGNRFVREDGRRDEISQAIMAQTGGYSWLIQSADIITDPDTQTTTLGQTITYMLENHLADYTRADTLEELAEAIGVPYENLQAAIDDYNAHVASGEADEFGRVLLVNKLETGPWYAFTRALRGRQRAWKAKISNRRVEEFSGFARRRDAEIPGVFQEGKPSNSPSAAHYTLIALSKLAKIYIPECKPLMIK